MAESKLAVASMDFAVKILKLCDGVKGHYSIINQLERSATSFGANILEANYAHSKPAFVSKLQILSKNVMKRSIGLNLCRKQVFCRMMSQKYYYMIAAQIVECWFGLLTL